MKYFKHILPLIFILLTNWIWGQKPWCPEPTNQLVNDYSQVLTLDQAKTLEQRLVHFDNTTSNQILVIITPTLHDCEIMDLGTRIGATWGVGQKGKNNGVIILIKSKANPNDYGDVAILPGYGLEGALPDVRCNRITQKMVPALAQGDYYTAIVTALDIIEPACKGEFSDAKVSTSNGGFGKVFIAILALIVIAFIIGGRNNKNSNNDKDHFNDHANDQSGRYNPFPFFIFPRGGGFGGGNFGGGFGNGGFGGFGGGSFGGGGSHSRF